MKRVLVTVLAVGVVMQSAHDHGSTGGAARGGGECMSKEGAVGGQGVDRRSLSHRVTITTEGGGLIIGDEENYIFLSRKRNYGIDHGKHEIKKRKFFHSNLFGKRLEESIQARQSVFLLRIGL